MPMRLADAVRRNLADAWHLFVLPLLLAALPWRLAFRAVRALAARAIEFGPESEAAWAGASAFFPGRDGEAWKRRYRTMRWIERVDTFLTLMRPAGWWQRQVDVRGELPSADSPGLLLTYHWGAGHWLWKLLRARGIGAHFLARRPQAPDHGRSRVALIYGLFRGRALRRIGSLGVLYTGGASGRIGDALARGEGIVGMLDLPSADATRSGCVRLLGRRLRWPSGLLDLALARQVPINLVSCGIDFDSGRRTLSIEPVAAADGGEALARYAAHLDAQLRRAPEAWHMWHVVSVMFADDAPCA